MDKFPLSMKEKYKGRLINREKQWPPRHSIELVQLQLVKGEGCSAQRGRDDKTDKRTPLAYGDLFKGESGKEQVRKVLVEGDAGIGKTTLTISLSEDWAREELFQEFELLLLLSLRQKEVASAGSLRKLLKLFHPSPRVCESVASYLEEEEAKKVLIIADGWDELGEPDRREGSFLYQLLFKMFPFMSVVVTSRPSASAPLHNLPCIDRFVEVSGFSKDDIKEYIQSEFSGDQEKARGLLEQLEHNPLIESTCSVPLNCAIVCHLWHTLEEALPSTMTQLYTKLILYVVCRNLRKLEAYGPTFGMSSFDELPEGLQQSWWLLCQFACEALDKDEIVFSKKELLEFFPRGLAFDEKILCFGLLQSAETVLDVTCVVSFNFVHLTFMEYLAALYLSRQPLDRQLQFLQKPRFTMVARFLFGICFSRSSSVTQDLDVKQVIQCVAGRDEYNKNELPLCHCAFEAQNNLINDKVIQVIADNSSDFTFGSPRTAHDCAAILYVMDNMQECSRLNIDFRNSGISENQIRILTDVLASKHGKLQVKELNLNGNKLTDKSVSDLFHRASAAFQSLTHLNLHGNSIGAESIKSITASLAKSSSSGCRLSLLFLSDNPLGVSGLQALESAVLDDQLSKVVHLNLDGSLTSDADTNAEWLTTFVESLSAHCPHLETLVLSQNNLGVPGATALARVISRLQHQSHSDVRMIHGFMTRPFFWSKILLNQTNLGDEGLCAFIENIDGVCHLEELELKDNGIHATGVSCLADAVCSGKIVLKGSIVSKLNDETELNLSDNPLGLEGTVAIGRMLSSNHCQPQSVYLSSCELTTAGSGLPNTDSLNLGDNISGEAVRDVGQQLCQMPQNNTITMLDLDGNSFTGEGSQILAGFLYICPCLECLFSRNCGITSDDLKQLFDKLSQLKSSSPSLCSKLDSWLLDNNEINDSGVSLLMDHLHVPSLFPRLGCDSYSDGIDLSNNPVSSEMEKMLEEELRRRKESLYPKKYKSAPPALPQSSSDGNTKGEEEPLSGPLPPPRPHPLTTSQCADVHQESLDGSGGRGNARVGPDSEGEPALEVQTTVNQSPLQMLDQVLDFENGGVSKHLGQIADSMYEWEGPVAEQLCLTPAEIVAIKLKYPFELRLQTRAALEKWKQKLGSSATYSNLIGVFERAGYQGYADTVHKVLRESPPDHTPSHSRQQEYQGYAEVVRNVCDDTPTDQRQECASACETSSIAVMDSICVMEKERSCDQSHDSSDPENEIFSTPPTSLVPPQHDDRELLDVSCGAKRLTSLPEPPTHKMVVLSSPQPELKDLDLIEVVNWQGVGLQLGVRDYELQKIKLDYHHHDDRKREMFRAWLRTCVNPNYHDLIKALEAVGERKTAQQLRDKIFNV